MTAFRSHPHPRAPRAVAWLLAALAIVLLGGGCGVPVEDSPRSLELTSTPSASATAAPGGATVRIKLIAGGELRTVERSTSDRTLESILAALAEGPTPAESAAGIGTALPPESFTAEVRRSPGRSLVVVTVGDAFTSISGDDQLLAAAQLVWTVTQLDPQGRVRLVDDDGPLEVVTDDGLTVGPVSREDFASVAPPGADVA